MKNSRAPIYWHILAGQAFLVVPLLLSPRPPEMAFFSRPTVRDILANIFMLAIFYVNYYLLIPDLYFKKKHVLYALTVIAGLVVISLLPSILTGFISLHPERPPHMPEHLPLPQGDSFFMHMRHNIFLYIVVVLFSVLLRIRSRLFDAETLKHHAEVGSLKSRINPHFLFNTLNNIYALAIREKATATSSSLLKLSGLMRYVVTETANEFVPLNKEIQYTDDYIELQKMRLTNTLQLTYAVTGDSGALTIAPMILMPFIENAFKHGVNPDQHSYIHIQISIQNNSLALTVENQKVTPDNDPHVKSGIGIENTKERLMLLYPDKHTLRINNEATIYRVELTLHLA